jgi:hypothetical protein
MERDLISYANYPLGILESRKGIIEYDSMIRHVVKMKRMHK